MADAPAPQAAAPQAEKQTNCLACNKPLKKLKIYYRNGKFYCTKKCWRKAVEKEKAKAAKEGAEPAASA